MLSVNRLPNVVFFCSRAMSRRPRRAHPSGGGPFQTVTEAMEVGDGEDMDTAVPQTHWKRYVFVSKDQWPSYTHSVLYFVTFLSAPNASENWMVHLVPEGTTNRLRNNVNPMKSNV